MIYKELDFTKPIETVASQRLVERVATEMFSGDYQFRFADDSGVKKEDGFGYYNPEQIDDGYKTFYANEYGQEFYGFSAGSKSHQRIAPILRNVQQWAVDFTKPMKALSPANPAIKRYVSLVAELGGDKALIGVELHGNQRWAIIDGDGKIVSNSGSSLDSYVDKIVNVPETRTSNKTIDGVPIIITYVDDVATKVELA